MSIQLFQSIAGGKGANLGALVGAGLPVHIRDGQPIIVDGGTRRVFLDTEAAAAA